MASSWTCCERTSETKGDLFIGTRRSPALRVCASGTMSEPMKVSAEISALAISTTYLLS
jgi:hypothetical protein